MKEPGEQNAENIRNLTELLGQLLDNQDWEKALMIGRYLAALEPNGIFAYRAMGLSSLHLRNPGQSEAYLLKAMENGDDDAFTFYLISRTCALRGDTAGEIAWIRKSLDRDPDNPPRAFSLALAVRSTGDTEGAKKILRGIVASHPDDIPPRRLLADLHLAAGDLDAAEEQLLRAAGNPDADRRVFSELAYVLKCKGRYSDALSRYFQALELDPESPARFYDIGDTFLVAGQAEKAIEYLQRAHQMNPDDVMTSYDLGLAYFTSGRYDECRQASRAALRSDPEMNYGSTNPGFSAMTNLGLAYMHLKNYPESEACFRKNLAKLASSHFNLGLCLYRQARYNESLDQFLRAIEDRPGDARYRDMAANAYLELGRLPEAREMLELAIACDEKYAPAHYDLGVVLSRIGGQNEKAMERFERAIAIDPAYCLPYYAIACMHAAVGRKALALEYLDHAVRRGYADVTWLDKDSDWDGLRSDPAFLKLRDRMPEKQVVPEGI